MRGKLIAIEAGDGSGKETQSNMLVGRLKAEGFDTRKVTFPDYDSQSSGLVKMYLRGDFGEKPDDVSPYPASTFYAVDRYASYKTAWESFYLDGGIILADRYTTSNMVHQSVKIADELDQQKYLDWLWDLEFVKLGLPVPDCVVFLDMPPAYSLQLMKDRLNKITGDSEKDIHERDKAYLERVYKTSVLLAEKFGWLRIDCVDGGEIRTRDAIHNDVYKNICSLL
ncbi:MAG TPA: thymidylate kinase [Bacillota bacterium]|nr:thymidylate kinase [Bacillota bacterium]